MKLSDQKIRLIARALADPRRYEILKRLGKQNCATPCSDMLECVDVTAPTLSHHMKELETAGLVRSRKTGKYVTYELQTQVLEAYLSRLKTDLNPAAP